MKQEDEDNCDDILTKVTNYVDKNLRVLRSLSWVLAGAGIFVILRRTYVFRQFKAVSDVPTEFVTKNIPLYGHIAEVRPDNTLGVRHIPLLQGIWASSQQPDLLSVSVLGVEFRDGGQKWLVENLMSVKVRMTPFLVTEDSNLSCIIYKKKGWLSSVCVNEELVRQGVAVTCPLSTLTKSTPYIKLQKRLLKAELQAEKKGVGIWVRVSLAEKLQRGLSLPAVKMKQAVSLVQNLSIWGLFARKIGKDDKQ
ncbi:protein C3orf33-like isoform X1 [Montipora foliosa]|uniref:protein C3orf33-like isoform X1 n=2 Tax=Montipora foliosa TaxID=591990 RepID=UPI0035F1BDD0